MCLFTFVRRSEVDRLVVLVDETPLRGSVLVDETARSPWRKLSTWRITASRRSVETVDPPFRFSNVDEPDESAADDDDERPCNADWLRRFALRSIFSWFFGSPYGELFIASDNIFTIASGCTSTNVCQTKKIRP